jgi:hypothetical protein
MYVLFNHFSVRLTGANPTTCEFTATTPAM